MKQSQPTLEGVVFAYELSAESGEASPSSCDPVVHLCLVMLVEGQLSSEVFGVVVVVEDFYVGVVDVYHGLVAKLASVSDVGHDFCFVGMDFESIC